MSNADTPPIADNPDPNPHQPPDTRAIIVCTDKRGEQANNRRTNVTFTHNGRTQTITEWARELGINPSTVRSRLASGKDAASAIGLDRQPQRPSCFEPYRGLKHNVVDELEAIQREAMQRRAVAAAGEVC